MATSNSIASPTNNLPEDLLARLSALTDTEQERLSKAESILACMQAALYANETQSSDAPCYAYVVETVREMLKETIRRFDPMMLSRAVAFRDTEPPPPH